MLRGNNPPVSRLSTYVDFLELTDADAPHDLLDLSGVTAASVDLCALKSDTPIVSKSLNAGVTLPSAGIIAWRFEPGDLSGLRQGDYRLLIRLVVNGDTVTVLDAILPLI